MNLKGKARVELTVAPDGTVTHVKDLGGNPVLLDALVRAVKKWKYMPATIESIVQVTYEFGPS
jgi:TonB family protein